MDRQVVIQVTDEMLERMLGAPLRRAVLRRAAVSFSVVVVVTALLAWRKGAGAVGLVFWPAAAGLFMAMLTYVDFRRLHRAAMAPYRKLPDRGLTYRFTDEAVEIVSINSYSICRWKNVVRVVPGQFGWCLYFGPGQFVVIPIEALDEELKGFIETAVARSR